MVDQLLDYETQSQDLATRNNPFSVIVMAHLKAQATRQNPLDRRQWKLTVVRELFQRGYERQDILELLRFIDWGKCSGQKSH